MRLLYVIHQFFPDCHSGTEQHCLAVAREARRRGAEVTVLSLHPCHEDEVPSVQLFDRPFDGFRVIRLNHWRRMNPNEVLRDYENRHLDGWFQQVLEEVRPQSVHFFHLRQLGSNLIGVARRNGIRTVVSLTDFWFLCPRFTLLRGDGGLCEGPPDGGAGCVPCAYPDLEGVEPASGRAAPSDMPAERIRALLDRASCQQRNLGMADVVVAPSRFLAEMFAKNGFPRDRVLHLPYGLEANRVEARSVHRPRSPMRIGFCGVLSPWKGLHIAVEAVRGLSLEVELQIHGRDREPMFQDYIDRVRVLAEGDPRIRFMGAYEASEASRVFQDMDVLVVPSTWYENTPFVVLEAFAAGVPVLASDLGGLSEIIVEGVNGMLFPAGDPAGLRSAIERVAGDPDWFRRLRVKPPPTMAETYESLRAAYEA